MMLTLQAGQRAGKGVRSFEEGGRLSFVSPALQLQSFSRDRLAFLSSRTSNWEDPVAYKQLMKEREEAEKSFEAHDLS